MSNAIITDMLTAPKVAERLGIKVRTVYALAQRGDLPSYRIATAVRFAAQDVETYLQSCRSATTNATVVTVGSSRARSTASGSDLASCFLRAGGKPKLTPTTAQNAPDSTRLQLVSPPTRR